MSMWMIFRTMLWQQYYFGHRDCDHMSKH